MKVLLDTHAFLWWISDSPKLSALARDVMSDGNNVLYFSAASGWEIAIKAQLGRLQLPTDLESFIPEQLAVNNMTVLPVQLHHALHVSTLPRYHRDPFDRILIAQSQVESLPLVTVDAKISRYAVDIIW
jgi:PIN domain nuclease of toxin-antitoxin system